MASTWKWLERLGVASSAQQLRVGLLRAFMLASRLQCRRPSYVMCGGGLAEGGHGVREVSLAHHAVEGRIDKLVQLLGGLVGCASLASPWRRWCPQSRPSSADMAAVSSALLVTSAVEPFVVLCRLKLVEGLAGRSDQQLPDVGVFSGFPDCCIFASIWGSDDPCTC